MSPEAFDGFLVGGPFPPLELEDAVALDNCLAGAWLPAAAAGWCGETPSLEGC